MVSTDTMQSFCRASPQAEVPGAARNTRHSVPRSGGRYTVALRGIVYDHLGAVPGLPFGHLNAAWKSLLGLFWSETAALAIAS